MNIKLVNPTLQLKEKALEYRQEHFNSNEFVINGSEMLDKMKSYEEWLERITRNKKAETVDPNWVVTDTFFALRESDQKIIGMIDFRHELKGVLKYLGNCGYSVRPSERRKGYATEMLKLLLQYAKSCGYKKIYLSVEKENAPSHQTILKNGGQLEKKLFYEGQEIYSYKIEL